MGLEKQTSVDAGLAELLPGEKEVELSALEQARRDDIQEQVEEVDEGPVKKELQRFRDPLTQMLRFRFSGGGEVPALLAGSYTDVRNANIAEERYNRGEKLHAPRKPKVK